MSGSSIKKFIIGGLIIVFFTFVTLFYQKKPEKVAEQVPEVKITLESRSVIGKSVEGRDIEEYTFGNGINHLIFVGGIHGGYEWNTVVLAYRFLDYLKADPSIVPENTKVTIIPSLNPDGVYKIVKKEGRFSVNDVPKSANTSPGRFNANKVDLNRNFDCKWQPKSTWQNKTVSAGSKVFSEPEAVAMRDYITKNKPKVVVFWHSQGDAVFASQCEKGILPETLTAMDIYAKASGYKAVKTFDAYVTTGDAESWLAKVGIPSITVELKTHQTVEWEQNSRGIQALLNYYK